jgi:hypothetical protein
MRLRPRTRARRVSCFVLALVAMTAAGARANETGDEAVRVSGYLGALAVGPVDDGADQLPQGRLGLKADLRAAPMLGGHVELRGRIGGPTESDRAGLYNLVHTFQDLSPGLEFPEAYLDLELPSTSVRAGLQRIGWGRLDGVPPTDVVNPRDYHDPIVEDFEEQRIGVPALQVTRYLPDAPALRLANLKAAIVYLPIGVPARLPGLDDRWFPVGTIPGQRFPFPRGRVRQSLAGLLSALCKRPIDVTLQGAASIPARVSTANHRPELTLDNGGIGFTIGGTAGQAGWDLYHYTGPETQPDLDLSVELVRDFFSLTPTTCVAQTNQYTARYRLHADALLRQASASIHMTGADWSFSVGQASFRLEAAYIQSRPYPRVAADLLSAAALRQLPIRPIAAKVVGPPGRARLPIGDLFVERDAVEWGMGVDSQTRGVNWLAQVNQIVLLESAPRLLIGDPDTRLLLAVRRPFLRRRLQLELRGVYSLERGGWFLFPQATYALRSNVRLRAGYLAIGGPRTSLIGQFGHNDEFVFEARYLF